MNTKPQFSVRAEKTGTIKDDLRVMIAGILFFIFLILIQPFAFFDNEQNVDSPDVPEQPFHICVRYDVEARDSGVNDISEKFCSEVFDPANPYLEIPDLNERGF